MDDKNTESIRQSYDRVADEYARRISGELQHKPFDREVLNRFAAAVIGRGEVCDMGCGPGHIARYLRDAGAPIFGLDLSPRMLDLCPTPPPRHFLQGRKQDVPGP